ncbi:MAG: alpha/beta hydrolase [Bryobacteraceae bacterium]
MKRSTFRRDELQLAYAESGYGTPFLFQQGLGADLQQTFDLLGSIPGVRLIAMDTRAHGASPVGDEEHLSFSSFAGDLLALLEHLQLSQVILGGLSMGAGIALNFALSHPQFVRALVLTRPAWSDGPMQAAAFYFEVARAIRDYGAKSGREQFARSETYSSLSRQFPDTARSLLSQFDSSRADDGVARLERVPADAPSRDRSTWKNIEKPALVLAHADDPVHPLACGVEIAKAIPGAQFIEITPKGANRERHEAETRAAVTRFIELTG